MPPQRRVDRAAWNGVISLIENVPACRGIRFASFLHARRNALLGMFLHSHCRSLRFRVAETPRVAALRKVDADQQWCHVLEDTDPLCPRECRTAWGFGQRVRR